MEDTDEELLLQPISLANGKKLESERHCIHQRNSIQELGRKLNLSHIANCSQGTESKNTYQATNREEVEIIEEAEDNKTTTPTKRIFSNESTKPSSSNIPFTNHTSNWTLTDEALHTWDENFDHNCQWIPDATLVSNGKPNHRTPPTHPIIANLGQHIARSASSSSQGETTTTITATAICPDDKVDKATKKIHQL
eukprot:jgi/Psemu1/39533/gm1.39533_g